MPQFEPYTLILQWNSIVIILSATIILLGFYILPELSKLMIVRSKLAL